MACPGPWRPCHAPRLVSSPLAAGGLRLMPRTDTTGTTLRMALALLAACPLAAKAAPAAGPVDYLRDVKPILSARCYSCHGALRQKSRLRLDTADLIRQGGKRGPAVVPGKSGDSLLIDA